MARIEDLAQRYANHISAPWQRGLAGGQKTLFVVYPKEDERRLRARIELFELATRDAGHGWREFDFSKTFAEWMAGTDYREVYFEEPGSLSMKLQNDFVKYAADKLRAALTADGVDDDSVVAAYGVAGLFGFTHVSAVIKKVESDIRGRLMLFFPGEYDDNNYRLLDARDGWNYLAVPITLHNGVNE